MMRYDDSRDEPYYLDLKYSPNAVSGGPYDGWDVFEPDNLSGVYRGFQRDDWLRLTLNREATVVIPVVRRGERSWLALGLVERGQRQLQRQHRHGLRKEARPRRCDPGGGAGSFEPLLLGNAGGSGRERERVPDGTVRAGATRTERDMPNMGA